MIGGRVSVGMSGTLVGLVVGTGLLRPEFAPIRIIFLIMLRDDADSLSAFIRIIILLIMIPLREDGLSMLSPIIPIIIFLLIIMLRGFLVGDSVGENVGEKVG